MSCRAWQDEIALLVGGDLPPDEAVPVEGHLESCSACRALAAELRADRRALAGLAVEAPPADALERMRRRAVEATAKSSRTAGSADAGGRGRGAWLGLAAALLAAAVALGLWTVQLRRPPDGEPEEGTRVSRHEAPFEAPVEASEPSEPEAPTRTRIGTSGDESPPTEPGGEPAPAPTPSPEEPEPPRDPDRLARADAGPAPERAETGPSSAQTTPSSPSEPITIRIVSEDPDIVFYWLTDEPKEVPDEASV